MDDSDSVVTYDDLLDMQDTAAYEAAQEAAQHGDDGQ